jgi:hypothetical protein
LRLTIPRWRCLSMWRRKIGGVKLVCVPSGASCRCGRTAGTLLELQPGAESTDTVRGELRIGCRERESAGMRPRDGRCGA